MVPRNGKNHFTESEQKPHREFIKIWRPELPSASLSGIRPSLWLFQVHIKDTSTVGCRQKAASAASKVEKLGVSLISRKRYLFVEFSNQDPYTAYPMVNLQQSVLLLMIPAKDWIRPVHRTSIGMLGSDSVPVTESHDKLYLWLTRVKPVNSFLSHVLPDQHGRNVEHDLSEISALWLNVNSGDSR